LAALWAFVWGISSLVDVGSAGDLKSITVALGALYLVIGFIEIFGIFACFRQFPKLVRTYAYLSVVAVIIVLAAESLRFATYFTHKTELINNCTNDATGETIQSFGSFWGGHSYSETLTQDDASDLCHSSWTRSVWNAVAWFVVGALVGGFLVSLAFSYYHQLLAPQPMAPSQAYAMNNFNTSYGGSYNPQAGYQYPAPPGAPPSREDYVPPYDPAKLPSYGDGPARSVNDEKVADSHAGSVNSIPEAAARTM